MNQNEEDLLSPEFEQIFKEKPRVITLHPSPEKKEFRTFNQLKNYIENEIKVWTNVGFNKFSQFFNQIMSKLGQARTTQNDTEFRSLLQLSLNDLENNHSKIFFSTTPKGMFLENLAKKDMRPAEAAYQFLVKTGNNPIVPDLKVPDVFRGVISAYNNFELDQAFIDKNENIEKSLEQMKGDYREKYDFLENDIKVSLDKAERNLESLNKNIGVLERKIENRVNDKFKDKIVEFNTYVEDSKTQVEEIKQLLLDLQKEHQDFKSKGEEQLDSLKNLFTSDMRLKGPVKYWEEVDNYYTNKGHMWIGWAFGTGVLIMAILALTLFSDIFGSTGSWLTSNFRSTIILATIVSTAVYLLRLFVKFSTSAIHLSRDAKERANLTHYFLSLIKEGAIKGKEFKELSIILQALFSRADTGLLKGDGAPTMPGGMIDLAKKVAQGGGK